VQLLSAQNRARELERKLKDSEAMAERLRSENEALRAAEAAAAAAPAAAARTQLPANGTAPRYRQTDAPFPLGTAKAAVLTCRWAQAVCGGQVSRWAPGWSV
jgi:hypothetical protein